MNVRERIFEILGLQDAINHTIHHAPPPDADITAIQEFRQEDAALRMLRHTATEELIAHIIRMEERVKELESIVANEAFTFRRVNND